MMYLLVGSIILVAVGTYLMHNEYHYPTITVIFGAVGLMVGILGLGGCVIAGVLYVSAGHEAKIINREYGTEYTQAEMFYARSVIDEVRHLNRQRIELNGDLLK